MHLRDDSYLVVHAGSQLTRILFGLGDLLLPPTWQVPTRVFRSPQGYVAAASDNTSEVWPVVAGRIEDVEAFCFHLRQVVRLVMATNPQVAPGLVPLLLLLLLLWLRRLLEEVTRFVFEELPLAAFTVLPACLAAMFAVGKDNLLTACVIDVGHDKTDVCAIVDYQPVPYALETVPVGGLLINAALAPRLPQLLALQIESLKRSSIFEVLLPADKKASFFGADGLEDEGALDVAAIVTSDDPSKALNAETTGKLAAPNASLEVNQFTDEHGAVVAVHKQRFQGTEQLIAAILPAVYDALARIDDTNKRQELWNNLVITGATTAIAGFSDALLVQLADDWLVAPPLSKAELALATYQGSVAGVDLYSFFQVPRAMHPVRLPEYFPEWKKVEHSYEQCLPMLGGLIYAKQVFVDNDEGYVTKQSYDEEGPVALWAASY